MVAANNAIFNTVGASISGVTNTLTVTNPSNTASSAARETIIVGGGTAGDPTINWNVSGVTNWEMGIDNSVSDNLTIAQGTALGTNDVWRMTTAGNNTKPLNSSFLVYVNADINNVTGDGTTYTIVYDTLSYDQNSNITLAGTTFTAPVTGVYLFTGVLRISALTLSASVNIRYRLNTPGLSFNFSTADSASGHNNTMDFGGSVLVSLTAGNAVTTSIYVDGITKTVGVRGVSFGALNSYWSGCLVT